MDFHWLIFTATLRREINFVPAKPNWKYRSGTITSSEKGTLATIDFAAPLLSTLDNSELNAQRLVYP